MKVVVLASQKGGAGKTTLSRHLAVEAERAGQGPVVLIDADPQGGLASWWNRRAAETPVFAESSLDELPERIEQARRAGFQLAVIDTPPQATALIAAVVRLADLVLIPTRPSPDDLDAVGRTIDIVEAASRPMVFVVNGATRNARITGQAAIALSQNGTVASVMLHHSIAYPTSAIDGRTVVELDPAGTPAREIAELWRYVSARLRKADRHGEADRHEGPVPREGARPAGRGKPGHAAPVAGMARHGGAGGGAPPGKAPPGPPSSGPPSSGPASSGSASSGPVPRGGDTSPGKRAAGKRRAA